MNVNSLGAGAITQLQYAVAMERKAQDTVREQGQQALQLIDAASSAKPPEGTGTRLDIVA